MKISELWSGGPLFKEEDGVFKIGADSVLLAGFAAGSTLRKPKRAADLGCGSGIIAVLLALNDPGLYVDAVDINKHAAELTLENAKLCGLADRITVVEGDLRAHSSLFQSGAYDLTISNPPYNRHGSGKHPSDAGLISARNDATCTLDDLCRAAGYLTRWGGSFFLVHKAERLSEVFLSLSASGFEPKRLRFVQHRQNSPPGIVLLESRRGGKPSLNVEAPLILFNEDGAESDEVKAFYHLK